MIDIMQIFEKIVLFYQKCPYRPHGKTHVFCGTYTCMRNFYEFIRVGKKNLTKAGKILRS